jgi:hypothetical protein
MRTYQFDAAAYQRIRLPWLLLGLFLSFTVDGILIWIWQTGVTPTAKFYWNVGLAFLCLINLVFMKGGMLYQYGHLKKMRSQSYVRLEKDAVVHYLLRTRMSHWQVEAAKETTFASNGKTEYVSADTVFIRQVKHLKQRSNGSIVIEGTIVSESLNEGWEEYSAEYGKVFKKAIKRHKIPAYYEGMDEIFHALKMLK